MWFLKTLVVAAVVFGIFCSLPTATKCDTSYYEKYHSARRYITLKRPTQLQFNFSITLPDDEHLTRFEQIALVGNRKQLGEWRASQAVLLNRTDTHNIWTGEVHFPANISVSYRYFIAARDNDTGTLQIRRWESHIMPRSFNITTLGGNRTDTFGHIAGRREVQRGWLNAGHIVQLKLFRKPMNFNESLGDGMQLRVKLQPIEPHSLTPILPSARASTEYVLMSYGNSWLRTQPGFGVPYQDNDILIFHTALTDLKSVAYVLKVYSTRPGSDLAQLIGYQYIYPSIFEGSEGDFTLNLISPIWLHTIGNLKLSYLVIAPMPNNTVDFHTTFVDYWRDSWTALDVGHRGLGKSLKQESNIPALAENTIASLKAAAELGADLVEFDVQLTSDLLPIIYHDYVVYVCMDPKKPTSTSDLTRVLIKDVTYWQLQNLKTYQVLGNKIIEYPAHNTVEQEEHRLFPLFADVLTKVKKSVGFDIEIKWPQMTAYGMPESIQTIDKNVYVDRILQVMQQHGCGRLSFFTSFDADICTLLRFKQNMYPVMFLTPSIEGKYLDPRSDTVSNAVNNAQAFDLAGIVPNAIFIQSQPSLVQLAQQQDKKVFLWGNTLKDATSIAWFKKLQPSGVIYDRLDLRLPLGKQSVFALEADLPQYLQLQCAPLRYSAEGAANSTIDSVLSNVNLL